MRGNAMVVPASLLAGLVVAGCAGRRAAPEPVEDPATRLGLAVSELRRGEYGAASRELAYVHLRYTPQPAGWKAMLLRIAAELDPRNADGRPAAAARIAAHALESGAAPRWVEPLAEALYLLAQDVSVPDSTPVHVVLPAPWDGVERDTMPPRPLPELLRPALALRLRAVEAEREQLAQRLTLLEQELAKKDQELLALDQELERIKKTLRP